ncbi:MAG: 50S ribosomal protein L11 methyltransferase [Thermoanaerobaculaceae bacterium]|nr:50S ribosomal protein L11 methyltransferase [Thermoanaerobaculaceae bacterium]
MSADYLAITCRLPASVEDDLASTLDRWPVLGCQVENAGPDIAVTVFIHENESGAVASVCAGLAALGGREIGTGRFAEQDWLAEYRRHAVPRPIGTRFWVDPHPEAPTPPPAGRIHLVVEPRQAFGSGSHESTRLVLLMMESLPLAGRRVLDVGTGSGILALAARSLGASRVVGFDIDLEAVCIAHQTVAVQPRRSPVALFAGSTSALAARPAFDVILANLIPAEAQPLLADLRSLLARDGVLVLSGLMADQLLASEEELARCGFAVEGVRELEEWAGLVCKAGPRAPGTGPRKGAGSRFERR